MLLSINDYLYRENELDEWIDRAEELLTKTGNVYAIANNHNVGKAVTNSLQIASRV